MPQSPYMNQVDLIRPTHRLHQVFDVVTGEDFSGGARFTPWAVFDQAPAISAQKTLPLEHYYKCTWCGTETPGDERRPTWCAGCGAHCEFLYLARYPQVETVPPGVMMLQSMNEAQAEAFRKAWLAVLT